MAPIVQLFITCIIDSLYPEIGEAVVRVLNRAGVEVAFPLEQTCCGQPAFNAGMRKEARRLAEHTIEVFEATKGPIILPSGSCAAMIRHGYLELFAQDSGWLERARNLAKRTYELTEFLVDELGVVDLGAQMRARLAYHRSCHLLRDLGVDKQPQALLEYVQGAELVELPGADECCGFGGIFSVEFADISSAMLAQKIANIQASGCELVVSCDAGCMTNINGGLHRRKLTQRAVHIAEVLASGE